MKLQQIRYTAQTEEELKEESEEFEEETEEETEKEEEDDPEYFDTFPTIDELIYPEWIHPFRLTLRLSYYWIVSEGLKSRKKLSNLEKISNFVGRVKRLKVRKEFKTFNEEARLSIHHWKDSWHKRMNKLNQRRVRDNPKENFSNYRITEVIKITTDQQHGLDERIIVMRENNKPGSFFKADFKYLNKNDIEDLYYLCLNKVHDYQLGIKSYQIRVKLTTPTLSFHGIKAHDPYSIVDKPNTGLIYLNNKEEKRVMYLLEIVKFCDATLERVLKEVKFKIFKFEPWKKPPLLGELDLNILNAYERQIRKRLRHRMQIRRWESFVNGRPILPVMRLP
nr:hypothetical protein [Tanacetum cinerariifolium]